MRQVLLQLLVVGLPADRKRVLVVEDDEDASIIYTTTLRHAGYAVEPARTLAEAETRVERRLPSIVVLDCRLPDGNGLDLLKKWKGVSPMAAVPVVVLTAFSDPETMDGATAAGADAFVVKPCAGIALTSFLERVLAAAKPTRRLPRLRMSTRFDAPPVVFTPGRAVEVATLHRIDKRHFQACCDTCHRSSPVVEGLIEDALKTVVALGWTTQQHGGFACPVCRDPGSQRHSSVAPRPRH
ncbi:MAG: chemotaxis protein CheY [Myxococcaceae bacterium]|jgi:DNA-binding response OmpR family regulator|nr:chemotaxis protein CheY [Myxococcaceae bacterium]MEA2751977.1 two-component system, cell cycle response regulator DivK [Myxococcales bacterium]